MMDFELVAVYLEGKDSKTGFMLPDGRYIFGTVVYSDEEQLLSFNPNAVLRIAPKEVQDVINFRSNDDSKRLRQRN